MNFMGALGSITSVIMPAPQAIKVFRMRQNRMRITGISLVSQSILIVNAVLWLIYGLLAKDWWVMTPSLICGPIAIYVSIAVWRASQVKQANDR